MDQNHPMQNLRQTADKILLEHSAGTLHKTNSLDIFKRFSCPRNSLIYVFKVLILNH